MLQSSVQNLHWLKTQEVLGSIAFELKCIRTEDICAEFGADRKGTKQDTLIDGITKKANPQLAEAFDGKRIIVSNVGKPLYLTSLDVGMLDVIPIPPGIVIAPTAPAPTNIAHIFSKGPTAQSVTTKVNDTKLAHAAKEFFMQIAGYLKLVYNSQDLYVFEVTKTPQLDSVAISVLNGGEPLTGNIKDTSLTLSIGIQKKVA